MYGSLEREWGDRESERVIEAEREIERERERRPVRREEIMLVMIREQR
jgi:hypothetical protein